MTDMREHHLSADCDEISDSAAILRQELVREINRLHRFSVRGILALALFLVVCLFAWYGFPFLPAPEAVTAALGRPPSARMINVVLLLYTFSALVLSLSRMATGTEHRSSFSHTGYLTVFFLFYYFGRTLDDNYWAVFGAGMTILGVESYRIWTFCVEGIAKINEDLDFVTRTGRLPPQE